MDLYRRSLQRHRETQGKIEVASRMRLESQDDLSIAYTPGVARPCAVIAEDPARAWDLTWKGRTVAVVSDGSAVLGLGDIGPEAALPVMEGKAALFREFGGVDAVPLVIGVREVDAVVDLVRAVAPTFGGINLEDIAAPRCFAIEEALQDLGIPVLHDDQHGTAVVVAAALANALKVTGRAPADTSVVINGAGAAGRALAALLLADEGIRVGKLRVCDSRGLIHPGREGNDPVKEDIGRRSNPGGETGTLRDVLRGADVFIGVSKADLLDSDDIRTMAKDPVVFALANPDPEIDPALALDGGAAVVGTGRSDYANQVNNVLAFPGLFRGALSVRAKRFTPGMLAAAAGALAAVAGEPSPQRILPSPFNRTVAVEVGRAVAEAARADGVCHECQSPDSSPA